MGMKIGMKTMIDNQHSVAQFCDLSTGIWHDIPALQNSRMRWDFIRYVSSDGMLFPGRVILSQQMQVVLK